MPRRDRSAVSARLQDGAEAALIAGLGVVGRNTEPETAEGLLMVAAFADGLARGLRLVARQRVRRARTLGATWADVGRAFGVTRQTAHQQFGRRS